jgi:hypothetical protein
MVAKAMPARISMATTSIKKRIAVAARISLRM